MKKIYAIIIGLMLTLSLSGAGFSCDACKNDKKGVHRAITKKEVLITQTQVQKPAAPKVQPQQTTVKTPQEHTYVPPLDILNSASKHLNKPVYIKAKFDKFSTLGLDYPPAMRSSSDYIAFLVQRNDVIDHNIPLSEVKFFLKRDYAEKFIDLDTGDVILIDGKMFSNALTDVWIDVDKIEIKEKVKKVENSK